MYEFLQPNQPGAEMRAAAAAKVNGESKRTRKLGESKLRRSAKSYRTTGLARAGRDNRPTPGLMCRSGRVVRVGRLPRVGPILVCRWGIIRPVDEAAAFTARYQLARLRNRV